MSDYVPGEHGGRNGQGNPLVGAENWITSLANYITEKTLAKKTSKASSSDSPAPRGPTERVTSTMATPRLRRPSLRHSFNHEVGP
jgi:hypothetical protein